MIHILFDLDIFRSFQIPTILSVHHLRLVVPGFLSICMYIYRRIDVHIYIYVNRVNCQQNKQKKDGEVVVDEVMW